MSQPSQQGSLSGQATAEQAALNSTRTFGASSGLFAAMGMSFNLTDAISFLALISPFLLAFLMVMISIINSNVKGLIYLLGLVILFVIVYLFQNTIKVEMDHTNQFCNIFHISKYNVPSFNSALYMYTIMYILFPMINMGMINFPLIIIFLLLYVADTVIKIRNKCSSMVGVIMGTILGVFFGITYFLVIRATGQTGLLYYDDLVSNKIACTRPTKQNFKCQVYKNGQLIQNI
uniref:Uncharacterized protein n=1 Tax=viral metagenome TaxID=1070528 RepID=A0A6C0D3N1_9ZZZZ